MVFIEICPVMMLTTGHTTTTWMLAMLADTTVTGGDMAPAVEERSQYMGAKACRKPREKNKGTAMSSYCLRVLLNLVGMAAIEGGSYGFDSLSLS